MAGRVHRSPSFEAVLEGLQKKFGARSVLKATGKEETRRVPTGVFHLDRILGGGLPVNRIIHISGHKASYKTTRALKALVNYQMLCGACFFHDHLCQCPSGPVKKKLVYVDVERAANEKHFARIGIDTDRLYISRPDYGEQACEIAETLLEIPETGAMIFDSLAALRGKDEEETSYIDGLSRGTRAKLIARLYRALISIADDPENPRLVICINHLLPNQKAMGADILPGGETQLYLSSIALRFWTKTRIKHEILRDGEEGEVGYEGMGKKVIKEVTEAKKQDMGWLIDRSKVSRENVSGEFKMFIEEEPGVRFGDADDWASVFLYGQMLGKIHTGEAAKWKVSGIGEEFQTQKAVMQFWKDHPELYATFKRELV